MSDALVCGSCGKSGQFTEPVSVVLVFAAQLAKPYPLIPDEDYRICGACTAIFTFIDKAVDAHPVVRTSGPWSRAVVLFSDGHGMDVKAIRKTQEIARA